MDKIYGEGGMIKQRNVILMASLVGMFSAFLPWLNIPMHGVVNGTSFTPRIHEIAWLPIPLGWFTFLLFLYPAGYSLLGKGIEPQSVPSKVIGILGLFSAGFGIYAIAEISSAIMSTFVGVPFGEVLNVIGLGLYLVIFCGALVFAVSFFNLLDTDRRPQ